MPLFFDPTYLLFMIPGMLLGFWAQMKVKSAVAAGQRMHTSSRLSGAEAASRILSASGLHHVGIEETDGWLGDHYDPRSKTLRLSHDVYHGRSIASVGIAAHEAGHALQDQQRYAPLALRNRIVPLASIGGNLWWIILMIGFFMKSAGLITAGIVMFSVIVLFQVINLPVEFNASTRARQVLLSNGIVTQHEDPAVAKVLNAAAMTYVAATISAILQLLYFLLRAGILGGDRD